MRIAENIHPERSADGVMTLASCILLYEGRGGSGLETYLATAHEVKADPGAVPEIGPGTPLSREQLIALAGKAARQAAEQGKGRRLIPAEVLYQGEDRMVWYRPARRLPIFFRTGRAAFDNALNAQEVLWPNLLFVADPGALKVFALADVHQRPTEATPVHFAPLYNLNSVGAMCAGNIRLPDVLNPGARERFEKAVYETEFTHSNYGSGRVTLHPGGHEGLWQAMRWRQAFRGFPARFLVPCERSGRQVTVQEVIEQ